MNAAGRLGLTAAALIAAFAAAYATAAAVVPGGQAAQHEEGNGMNTHDHGSMDPNTTGTGADAPAGGHEGHGSDAPAGLSLAAGGYALTPVAAPRAVGEAGELSFRILDAAGAPVTAYEPQHEKELHLIVVRSDGTAFRHVHPVLDASAGTWSIPWTWDAAGTYRVFADFAPTGGEAQTLTRTVDVAGAFAPAVPATSATTSVDGFDARITGDLVAGAESDLTVTISRNGAPVTGLEPYLGAFGHLVALREGDLAYLHVHPEGASPEPGATSGPDVGFAAHVPTAGRYLLFFDFQVDGVVRTASFALDATAPAHH